MKNMKRTLFEELSDMVAAGTRFNQDFILSVESSPAYQECNHTESAFIDVLFKEYAEPQDQNLNGIWSLNADPPPQNGRQLNV